MSVLTSLVGKVSALSAVAVAVVGMAAPAVASANQGPREDDCVGGVCHSRTPHCKTFRGDFSEANTYFVCDPYEKGQAPPKYL